MENYGKSMEKSGRKRWTWMEKVWEHVETYIYAYMIFSLGVWENQFRNYLWDLWKFCGSLEDIQYLKWKTMNIYWNPWNN